MHVFSLRAFLQLRPAPGGQDAKSSSVAAGLAMAERLGAPYPFPEDKLAREQFDTYLKLAHGLFARRKARCNLTT